MTDIFCIWYPSGGFGHFINAVLTLHGKNFAKSKDKNIVFDSLGTSHNFALIAPKYFHDPAHYDFNFNNSENYSVLIDNGINNETKTFVKFFPDAQIIKLCYSDRTWPIVARTMIEKAMRTSFDSEIEVDKELWPVQDSWAKREKYFLFLKDHALRHAWKLDNNCLNLFIDDMLDYQRLKQQLEKFQISLSNFEPLWNDWLKHNYTYINSVTTAEKTINAVRQGQPLDLSTITDIWTQSVIYYFIWLTCEFEVPHNDYKDWFTNTKDIVTMLDKHGVSIDSNQKPFC